MGQTFSSKYRSNNDNYYNYISYAIFALIFVTAFFWTQSIKLIFNKIFFGQDINHNSSGNSLLFNNSNDSNQLSWKAVLVDLAYTIILTIITIILIIIFHPSLSSDSKDNKKAKVIEHIPMETI